MIDQHSQSTQIKISSETNNRANNQSETGKTKEAMNAPRTPHKSTSQLILEAICEMHDLEQVITRETLAAHTGLKLTIIDDRVSDLIDNGHVDRVQRGVFVPAPKHPPARLISKTVLPGGTVKIEIGDDHVITLTPREDRYLANLMAGSLTQLSMIEIGHNASHTASELSLQLRQVRKRVAILESNNNE